MAPTPPDGWTLDGFAGRGGQGESYFVRNVASGDRAFAKFLKANNDARARRRFVREVTAYETLAAANVPNLPKLLDHNADRFQDRSVQLALILEPIDGVNLARYIDNNGPMDLPAALAMMRPLLATLTACHAEGELHRDIKPANVMLRDGDPTAPVLVDFGLSFNTETDSDDLTRTNEDIGNRFLHLPEQSFDRHNPRGDVSQAAGLLIYCLTGAEPRVLIDDDGNMPHQRAGVAERLAEVATGAQLRALLAIFDSAFAVRASSRMQTVTELSDAIDLLANGSDEPEQRTLVALLERLNRTTNTASNLEMTHRRQRLNIIARAPIKALAEIVANHSLQQQETGQTTDPAADPPMAQNSIALAFPGDAASNLDDYVTYVYTLHGDDIVLHLGGLAGPPIWRGRDTDSEDHNEAVRAAALARLLPPDQDR